MNISQEQKPKGMFYHYQVELKNGSRTCLYRHEANPKKYVNNKHLVADDCAEEYEESINKLGEAVVYPIKLWLFDKQFNPMGRFKVSKGIEVSYYSEEIT